MNRFKLFEGCDGFVVQLKDNRLGDNTFWWIGDLHCGEELIPDKLVGWRNDGEVGKFIGYITFKEVIDNE